LGRICKRKEFGGLGVINLADFNNALLNKWMWKIFDDTDELYWPNLVLNNYYKGNKENVINGKHRRKSSYFWQGVLKTFDMLKVGSRVDVGDGITTLFWQDIWMGEVSFNTKFFNLSHFINNPIVTVREKLAIIRPLVGTWVFKEGVLCRIVRNINNFVAVFRT